MNLNTNRNRNHLTNTVVDIKAPSLVPQSYQTIDSGNLDQLNTSLPQLNIKG